MSASELPVVTVHRRKALPFFSRHPWVFAGAIERVAGDPQCGDVVRLHSHEDEFIAWGLFNPHSNIRVRLYSWAPEDDLVTEPDAFWSRRLAAAVGWREQLWPDADVSRSESACRLVSSEADGLSGLTVDRYGDWLLVQLTSRALAERLEMWVRLLREQLKPRGIWLRTEKGIRESEGLEIRDQLLDGAEPPRPLFLAEHSVRLGVDVVEGQKTGHFLDQRENRQAAARFIRGGRILDLFCYTGGFSLAALVAGAAQSALAVDSSESALQVARANAELNGLANRTRFERADAFGKLEQLVADNETFEAVILDPPKMARHRRGIDKALRGYYSLNRLAVEVLKPGGILVTCSCSGLVTAQQFREMLARVAVQAERPIQILEARGAAADHPVSPTCPENEYLKCLICRVV